MSKLAMFKELLTPDEAAHLLSRLINEPVSTEDFLELVRYGWVPALEIMSFQAIPLRPMRFASIDINGNAIEVEHGALMHPHEPKDLILGTGFHHPCDSVLVDNRYVLALSGADGQKYAMGRINSDYLYSPEDSKIGDLKSLCYETKDIYALAEIANKDEATPIRPSLRRQVRGTDSDAPLFNLASDSYMAIVAPVEEPTYEISESAASPILTIVSLLEQALLPTPKKRTQGKVIADIQKMHPDWPLSDSNLTKLFADAKKIARNYGHPETPARTKPPRKVQMKK